MTYTILPEIEKGEIIMPIHSCWLETDECMLVIDLPNYNRQGKIYVNPDIKNQIYISHNNKKELITDKNYPGNFTNLFKNLLYIMEVNRAYDSN